jgi:F-type H+-transporting ATPase subunit a
MNLLESGDTRARMATALRRGWPGLIVLLLAIAVVAWMGGTGRADVKGPPAEKEEPAARADSKGSAAGEKKAEEHHEHDPFEEFQDSDHWVIFHTLGIEFHLPHFNIWVFKGITKFMILEVVAALLIAALYIPLARRVQSGAPPQGAADNFLEVFLTFIRNDIARPNLGEHDADHYVPFLWTLFLFILFNNLLGMIPFMGSPTANLYVTGALALCSFVAMHGAAMAKMGFFHYVKSLWPHMDVPFGMGYFLKPMIFFIEVMGTVIKSGVLAVRLFANMFAGHTVLAMILAFIVTAVGAHLLLWGAITAASVLGVVALSLLELFVAFLQSYIFVFLTALFMGMALHPSH